MSDSRIALTTARHYRWADLPAEPLKGTISRKLVSGDRMMIAHVYFKQGVSSSARARCGRWDGMTSTSPARTVISSASGSNRRAGFPHFGYQRLNGSSNSAR
ncbi:MAG: hypothetical protein ACREV5_19250 [Steroidobacter sp.]